MKRSLIDIATCVVILFVVIGSLVLAAKSIGESTFNPDDYEVQNFYVEAGETLSNIAAVYKAQDCNWRDYVTAVRELNEMGDRGLQADTYILIYVLK